MPNILNIQKEYTVDKTFEELFKQLHTIISTPFNSSKFSTFGNYDIDIPGFILMAKWTSFGRPIFADVASTKIVATLSKSNDKTKIIIATKTNPVVFVAFFFCILGFIINIATYKNIDDAKAAAIYFFLAIATLGFDRFIKNILVRSFEEDMTLN